MSDASSPNVDPHEVAKFEDLAHRWWDPQGEFRPLHEINPLRLDYVERRVPLGGARVLDVGCGGGILAESMVRRGAQVTGIDMAAAPLEVARMHLLESGLEVDYRQIPVEELADGMPGAFDVVTCMEMLEHVPDPASVVEASARLVRPGGHVFFSTINRNPKSFLFAIVGAEYLLHLLPRGTHEYARFIRPSELAAWARGAGLETRHIGGLGYNPLTGEYRMVDDVQVNYLMHTTRDA
jgi:2-polyprenyl-6-hydroxyphenyl methylase / 3-demethylubiquinone-9 3-methyltransferase